jgi:hypothetical protein
MWGIGHNGWYISSGKLRTEFESTCNQSYGSATPYYNHRHYLYTLLVAGQCSNINEIS